MRFSMRTAAMALAALVVVSVPGAVRPAALFSASPEVGSAAAVDALPGRWYFAEGTTREGFYEYLSLQNPGTAAAEVRITYMTNDGPIGPFVHTVPPVSRATVFVNGYLDPGLDVSAAVESDRGLVAERPMYFSYRGKWHDGHVTKGVNEPGRTWYFAEGTTRPGFEEWLCIQNPLDVEQGVTVGYFTPEVVEFKTYRIAALHRFTLDINREVAGLWPEDPHQDVSLKVEAEEGVIAERPMYFDYKGSWQGGHIVVGETAPGREWYLAEGYCEWNFETWLCFLNPGLEDAHITVNYRRGDGAALPPQRLKVSGYSRFTLYVNDVVGKGEFSFHILSDRDIVVERPMYFNYRYTWAGGHDTAAVPRAAPEWFLAEGSTRRGIETYLCVLNPLEVGQRVMVEYLLQEGGYREVEFTVPPRSRYTRNVNADLGEGYDVSFRVKALKDTETMEPGSVVVERPIYFLYGGTIPGGHVTSGYAVE
ncbi:MAG: hypothetical protein QME88_07340 [Actinomycetota bacterium]|nr:hypothetical protein [Actinomycetota bacterium]